MNSDIDNNSDTPYSRLIAWLLQESVPAASSPADGQAQSSVPTGEQAAAFELDHLDPVDLEALNIASSNPSSSTQNPPQPGLEDSITREEIQPGGGSTRPYNLGEIPTVEHRFQTLLKRRLQVEIERNPPLFPWETEISDYETDSYDSVGDSWVPPVRLWMPQLSNLPVPSIPETVLAQLLEACSEAAYSRRQIGAKMVNAVEKLFPDQFPLLNRWTDRLLLGAIRSEKLQYPSYEDATTEQQMTLALLAAKEIISALTVPISATKTPVERKWQTAVGVVSVQADYQMQEEGVPRLRVSARLPRGGSLTLRTPQSSASSQRVYPGYVSVESFDLQPNQSYPLEIRFHNSEQTPLIFSICPTM